uniref:60S ribosomal protein L10a n=1 Tax=Magallana gigas TaxID=29159 RepID=A0A8W8MJF4_MAGGI
MSKINRDNLNDSISAILQASQDKPRKFTQSVELQIVLKNYDPQKDRRFAGTVRLRTVPRPKMKICILGDQIHCDQAKANNLPCMTAEKELAKCQSSVHQGNHDSSPESLLSLYMAIK